MPRSTNHITLRLSWLELYFFAGYKVPIRLPLRQLHVYFSWPRWYGRLLQIGKRETYIIGAPRHVGLQLGPLKISASLYT